MVSSEWAFLEAQMVKNLPPMQESWVQSLGQEDLQKGMQPTPAFLPGKSHGQRSLVGYSPWGQQRVKHNWVTNTFTFHFRQWIKNELLIPKCEWVSDILLSERNQTPERAHSIICSRISSRIAEFGTSLVVWWLRLCTSIAGGNRVNPWSGN